MARPQNIHDIRQINRTIHGGIHADLLMGALPEISSHVARGEVVKGTP